MRYKIYALFLATMLAGAAIAEEVSDEALVETAKVKVANALGRTPAEVAFEEVRVSRDQSNAVVCGTANRKRFVAGTTEKAGAPTIEGSISTSVFNYLWNLRCSGMKTNEALSSFGEDLREDVCTVENWNWTRWGTRSIQIQGLASCQTGRILIKAFEDSSYLGSGTGRI